MATKPLATGGKRAREAKPTDEDSVLTDTPLPPMLDRKVREGSLPAVAIDPKRVLPSR